MTRISILVAAFFSAPAFSQNKPSVLEGVKFQTETLVTEKGEEFTAFLV